MLTGLFNNLFRHDEPPAPAPPATALPSELVLAIETAEVFWRPSRANDDEAGPIVNVVGVGRWVYNTADEAADRVARAYPELPRNLCLRAAHLIYAQVGRRNAAPRNLRSRRTDRPLTTDYTEP